MTDVTPLDQAYLAMESQPDNDSLRLAFYGRLLDGVLYVLLDNDPDGETLKPRLFPLDDGPYVLVFDTEDRLAAFAAGPAPYAALPGARIIERLAENATGLALNLGDAPSQMMLPSEVVTWLAQMAGHAPQALSGRIEGLAPPSPLPDSLIQALDRALARAEGLAKAAFLCGVTTKDSGSGHLVAFLDAAQGAEDSLAQAVQAALTFSGAEGINLDVAFVAVSDPIVEKLAKWGIRFDLPELSQTEAILPPGGDPDRPPRLS